MNRNNLLGQLLMNNAAGKEIIKCRIVGLRSRIMSRLPKEGERTGNILTTPYVGNKGLACMSLPLGSIVLANA